MEIYIRNRIYIVCN